MKSKSIKFILLGLFSFLSNCDLPHQPGPMPSVIVETEFEPGLNILGILRADDVVGSSFININRALTTEEIYSDSTENFSPDVDYVKIYSHRRGTNHVFQAPEDSSGWGSYRDTALIVMPGDMYDLEIKTPGFPTLTGRTRIPLPPLIVLNSLSLESGNITFQIQHGASAYEYKMYLMFSESVLEKVVKISTDSIIDVDWSFDGALGTPLQLMLFALDENLTRYGNSPISFIPNTYHTDGSTVDGGYGCFGSVTVKTYDLQ